MNQMLQGQPEPDTAALSEVAEKLRLIRMISQQKRYKDRPAPCLPSRSLIDEILSETVGLLYPAHFGPVGMCHNETEAYVARTLPTVQARIARQIALEWMLSDDADPTETYARAEAASLAFVASLPVLRDLHDTDIAAAYAGDPSAKSLDEIIFCFPGIAAVLRHRIAHVLYGLGATMIARIMAEQSHSMTGIDIHPGARIGPAFFIDHGTGVVIGETAIIGRNVRLYQQVTLGAKRFEDDGNGQLIKGRPRHPVIEDDVVIYAGATILGRITIGRGAVIGGGVWLTRPVPAAAIVTQAAPELSVLHPATTPG
ncbi:serine O-acetyltransferase EpsC [Paracoccus aminophilus]|nr:serine O-acetyltransferase EpsC [Paracoccus aminophilus]